MGPQPSSRGNNRRSRRQTGGSASFNGAATFQSRKSYDAAFARFKRGELQWGRNLPVAEISRKLRTLSRSGRASMGPQPSSRGNYYVFYYFVNGNAASMGPQPSSRGNADGRDPRDNPKHASMGPQPSSRGNMEPGAPLILSVQLQWGRNLPVAEMSCARTGAPE